MRLKRTSNIAGPAVFCVSFILCVCGCVTLESLKGARPIFPIKDYERMIVGRIDADYIGTDRCLEACHYHDKIRRFFDASTMGAQLSPGSGMPVVDCESCHGPGSLAVEGITHGKVEEDRKQGKRTCCNNEMLLDLDCLPAGAKSLICLKCHTSHALFNLHNWNASAHAQNDVSCSDCHPVHVGPDLTTKPKDVAARCFSCHPESRIEFTLPSHHAVLEKRIFCNDCHEPHGSITEKQLKKATLKETCAQCHAEKAGPFTYEHADNTENCSLCHEPHGSVNNNLLVVRQPFLCLQCHASHRLNTTDNYRKGASHTRCTDCHSRIHGTDLPSTSGGGNFTQ